MQGGVESQRWGHFAKVGAKRKGGVKSQRKGGVKTQMGFFRKSVLEKVALSRGYYNMRAISDGLAPVFETTSKRMQGKLERGQLTKEECEVIGAYFEMTMKEYYEVFMDGLFQPDVMGHYRCHIENMKEHMNPPEDEEKPKKIYKYPKRRREQVLAEIMDEIEKI